MFRHVWRALAQNNRQRLKRRAYLRGGRTTLDVETLEARWVPAGTWTALGHVAPSGIGTMELLTDGTVMAQGGGVSKTWYRLTPDSTGSYVNGTWSSLASMSLERLYTATNVLPDGRVFVLGGEYSGPSGAANFTNTGEIFNPLTNSWSSIANFPQTQFGDDPSMLLPDGRILAGYISGPATWIYNPATNTWTAGGTKLRSDRSDEETWVKLPDNSVLSYDIFTQGATTAHAQHYIPATNTWVDAGTVPVLLSGSSVGSEMGPASLLPDGRVLFVGATGHTAYYTPSTNTWAAGPDIPNGGSADDSPGAMLPNGNFLFAADTALFNPPTRIYELNPLTNGIVEVTPTGPNLSGSPAYVTRMLMLPSGQVLFTSGSSQLYVYTPSGAPQAAWQPTISSVVPNGSNYTLTGTQLNGLSAGASYGDDAEMDTNYPIIELKNSSGKVYFARTFNWSSTGVATGSTLVSTDFSLPTGLPSGNYLLYVVTNGIASAPYSFSVTAINADLAVSNSGPSSVNAGSTATYTITVTNNGPNAAQNVVLSNTLPAGSTLVSLTPAAGNPDNFTVAPSSSTATAATVTAGTTDTFTLVVSAPSNLINGANFSETASVSSGTSDPNSANNSATVTGSIINSNQSADLVVANTGPATSNEGFNITYNVTLTNNGPTNATAVVLKDTLGTNLKFISATTSKGTFTTVGGVVTFSLGVVNAGQTVTITVTAQSLEDGNLTNTASASGGVADPNTSNNSAVATTAVAEGAIVVSGPIAVNSKKLNNQQVATFTHANGVEPTSAFVATIDWGDGTSSNGSVTLSGTSYQVRGTHTYSKNGTHTITTTVVESETSPNNGAGRRLTALIASGPASNHAGVSVAVWVGTTAGPSAAGVPTSTLGDAAGIPLFADTDSLDAYFALLEKLQADGYLDGKNKGWWT